MVSKLKSHNVDRQGDRMTVSAVWANRFKRPQHIDITRRDHDNNPAPSPILQGDVKDVQGILNGLAEIAWENGWRPANLAGRITHAVLTHKIPKED